VFCDPPKDAERKGRTLPNRPELYFHCRSTLSLIIGALACWSSRPRGEQTASLADGVVKFVGPHVGHIRSYDLPDEVYTKN
jgi:hypothetical protein